MEFDERAWSIIEVFLPDNAFVRKIANISERFISFLPSLHLPVLLSRNVEVKYCRKNSIEFIGGGKVRYSANRIL